MWHLGTVPHLGLPQDPAGLDASPFGDNLARPPLTRMVMITK
jgi:hypothetical protein